MRKTMCILLATALTTSMLSETPFLSRSVHSPMSYPTKAVCFDAGIRHTEYDSDSLLVWDFPTFSLESIQMFIPLPRMIPQVLS